jgi:plasmid replication initiation protein
MATEKQIDLFLDSLVDTPIKDDRALMEFPFFSLKKQPRHTPIVFQDSRVKIEITGGERGIATIWDKDVIIYVISLINDRIERGAPVSPSICFAAHDFLTLTGRGTSATVYEQFKDTLFRLRSTTIKTSIVADGEAEERGFGWIDSYRIHRREIRGGRKIMAAVEVKVNDWMFRAIVKDRRILTIHRDYFGLKMALERRLYELARKHLGSQNLWTISLPRLHQKCDAESDLRQFKAMVAKVAERDRLPEFHLDVVESTVKATRLVQTKALFLRRAGGTPRSIDDDGS